MGDRIRKEKDSERIRKKNYQITKLINNIQYRIVDNTGSLFKIDWIVLERNREIEKKKLKNSSSLWKFLLFLCD